MLELPKAQTARLREEQQEILHRTPLRSHFYQHYHNSNPKQRRQKLKRDQEELQHQAGEEERITRSITNIATLGPYLEDRQDSRHEEELAACLGKAVKHEYLPTEMPARYAARLTPSRTIYDIRPLSWWRAFRLPALHILRGFS
nr:hypothetical protein [uncultured Pseudomonas sp.]